MRRLAALLDRLAASAALPDDDADTRLRKGALLMTAALIVPLATFWVVTYAVLGLWLSAAIPFAYQVVSVGSIAVFLRTKRFLFFRRSQLLMMLALPFLLQWSLGGFAESGAVMVWAIAAPFGSLAFQGWREATPWFAAYLALTGVSAAIDPLLPGADLPSALVLVFFALNIAAVSIVVFLLLQYFVRERERALAALDREHRLLVAEQERSERLLLNVLPREIAGRLKQSDGLIADGLDDVTVLFADIVGFTPLAERMTPAAVVELLNEVFSTFDDLADRFELEKIKTIGDGYMVAGGLPTPRPDHVEAIARMALEMRDSVPRLAAGASRALAVRIGVDTGPVVAGVIGRRRFSYDLWGDTVNTASRMELHGRPGEIQVTERTYERLKDGFVLESRGVLDVKGKGLVPTYLLLAEREAFVQSG
jgi:adenylate cyclase